MEKLKEDIVRELPITKNANLYTVPEIVRYKKYNDFKEQDISQRQDHYLLLRTDDIDGAQVKKRIKGAHGKKT